MSKGLHNSRLSIKTENHHIPILLTSSSASWTYLGNHQFRRSVFTQGLMLPCSVAHSISTWEHRPGCFCLGWNALLRTDQEQHTDNGQVMFWRVQCQVHVMRIYFCQQSSPILLFSGPGVSAHPACRVTKCHWASCPHLGRDPDFALWRSPGEVRRLKSTTLGPFPCHSGDCRAPHFLVLLFLHSIREFIINYRIL